MRTTLLILLCLVCLFPVAGDAQEKTNSKFGKVSAGDFTLKSPVIDSNTSAVVLSDVGTSKIEGNNKGWFSLIHKRTTRIKILDKKGFDAGNVSIDLYTSPDGEEKLTEVKGITYNLENGIVQQTKLESSNIFREKQNRNWVSRKFTFPNLKEGSIVEYTYSIESEFLFNLRSWEFQGDDPRLFTQYTVYIPEFFQYVFLSQGYVPLKNTRKDVFKSWSVTESNGTRATEHYTLSGYETQNTWSATDVPALKEEPFTSSIENHNSKIDFQLSQYRFPNTPPKDVMGNWATASEQLLKHEDFGGALTRPNFWLGDEVKKITSDATTDLGAVQAIYAFVRDHFTATGSSGFYMSDNTSLKDVFRKKNGTGAEINMLLIAMLRQRGITADPVLLSTRSHGLANPFYPLLNKYNYLICAARIDGKSCYLDATRPRMGFGKLPAECYNGSAFLVSAAPRNLSFDPDSLQERKTTLLFLVNNADGKGLSGSYTSTPGYFESCGIRDELVTKDAGDYLKEAEKAYSFPVRLSEIQIDSLKRTDLPISVKYKMSVDLGAEDMIYLNPMFSEAIKKNPFVSAERKYPVEMPYTLFQLYVLNMEIPKGYEVEEIPKSARVRLNDNEGVFEYIVSASGGRIMLQSKIDIKRAYFRAEDYQSLRDFFGHIARKHSEQIVLKRIKN
ncbi:transglutaminase domain-containing protein [Niabella hirudinis]|uniref:transglutaminase domain-containing protein n=1 Tax=Niabella hirudinis TaxID=1285929 RepID=UPI003EBA279A